MTYVAARLLQVIELPFRGASFTAVTRGQIPSGTPNLFSNLWRSARIFVGTKRHNSDQRCCLIARVFAHLEHLFTGTKRHTCKSMRISRQSHPVIATALIHHSELYVYEV